MTLRALLPGLPQRYAFVGLALGSILPVAGHSIAYFTGRDGAGELRLDEPFHALVLLLPLLLGVIFYRFGLIKAELLVRLSAGEVIERELLHISLHDNLTGLPNRASLEREVGRFASVARRGLGRAAFLLLDLDKFKHVNDTLGHDAGDELLQVFAARLLAVLGPRSRCFRLGGDEFVVTVSGMPDDSHVTGICRAIEGCAGAAFDLRAGRAFIGVSIGVSYVEGGDMMPDVMRRADLALYAAKDVAGSTHRFHEAALAESLQGRMRLEQEIASGLLREEFFVEYQPVVNASTREVAAFEALVRWQHPQRGLLGPEHFITVAERSGHMVALGRYVLSRAIEDAGRWPVAIGVAVNVCADELRHPHFASHIGTSLEISGVDPARLTVEITEAAFTIDAALIRRQLTELRRLGVKVAIDDFGAGFSTINHLRQFPVDQLKVDRSFTRELLEGGQGTELVEILLRLGKAFGVRTTVEGIENEDQFQIVRALGAADVQGFLISRPLAVGAANDFAVQRIDPFQPSSVLCSA